MPSDPIDPEVTRNPDGTVSETYRMTLTADTVREVHQGAVEALDAALGRFGEVLHAIDPSRILTFEAGGPPVWSVGMVRTDGDWLLVTYGMSELISPEASRAGIHHEYSLRIPGGAEPPVWGPALLRHLARYVLRSGADLQVGDTMPFGHPISRVPFQPEHHAGLPDSALTAVVVAADPLLPSVEAPLGAIEVRRLVGVHQEELELLQTWSAGGFLDEMARVAPTLASDLARPSLLADPAFRERARARARAEGGNVGMVFVEGGWEPDGDGAVVQLPGGDQAAQIRRVLEARIPFGRPLYLQTRPGNPIALLPGDGFAIYNDDGTLVFEGSPDHPDMKRLLQVFRDNVDGVTFRLG
jgi:hypothetical protein